MNVIQLTKKVLIVSLLLVSSAHAELVQQFRSPAFNGINYSGHVQTIENTEKTRREAIENAKLQADRKSTRLNSSH